MIAKVGMTINIAGAEDIIKELKKLSDAVAGEHLEASLRPGAKILREEASNLAPKRTGELSRNIFSEVRVKSKESVIIDIGPSPQVFYGQFVEFGTSKMTARPFLRPALNNKKAEVEDVTKKELRRRLGL